MDKKYIERETALKTIDNYSKTVNAEGKVIVKAVRDIVDFICPPADVQVVRHGKNITKINPVDGLECDPETNNWGELDKKERADYYEEDEEE